MASVLEFPSGRGFQFTIEKAFTASMGETWVNSYWSVSIGTGTLTDLVLLGRALVELERTMTFDTVTFTRWSVRTGAQESPHTSENFYTETIGQTGRRLSAGNSVLDKRVVMWLAKTAMTGRAGRAFLRGAVSEEDTVAAAGSIALTTVAAAALALRLATAINATISEYLNGGGNGVLRVCLLKPDGSDIRNVREILLNGVTIAQHNHAYFDRGLPKEEGLMPENLTPPTDVVDEIEEPHWEDPDAPEE